MKLLFECYGKILGDGSVVEPRDGSEKAQERALASIELFSTSNTKWGLHTEARCGQTFSTAS